VIRDKNEIQISIYEPLEVAVNLLPDTESFFIIPKVMMEFITEEDCQVEKFKIPF
jgi:hypothetical protein